MGRAGCFPRSWEVGGKRTRRPCRGFRHTRSALQPCARSVARIPRCHPLCLNVSPWLDPNPNHSLLFHLHDNKLHFVLRGYRAFSITKCLPSPPITNSAGFVTGFVRTTHIVCNRMFCTVATSHIRYSDLPVVSFRFNTH